MITSLADACHFVLVQLGEPQTSFWLASQVIETKLWRATEAGVRRALREDIRRHGELSRFVELEEDLFALTAWINIDN